MIIVYGLAITGAGVITGLLFAFSNFVMRVLAELPNENGMFVMQQINERIINPVFIMFFFGTPILCILIATQSMQMIGGSSSLFLAAGSLAYLIGPFGITMVFNVPLNNELASTELSDAETAWPIYQKRWQYWNHIRTYIGVISIALLAFGIGGLEFNL